MNMVCAQFEQVLEDSQSGVLPATAQAHLLECSQCQLLWNDLEAIRTAADEWGADVSEPPARLWTALRIQLETEGLIREPAVAVTAKPDWLAAWFGGAHRLAMTGAYTSLLVTAAILLTIRIDAPLLTAGGRSSFAAAFRAASVEPELGRTLDADLKRVMAALPERNPSLASSLQKNLGIVDNMISLCEKSVREQPSDPMAREYLYGAYQQKADLLATALDRSTLEEK